MPDSRDVDLVRYFDDTWDGHHILASLPPWGFGGIFRLPYANGAVGTTWAFLDPHTAAWDSAHQRAYRSGRADPITDPARIASLPALPPVPAPAATPEQAMPPLAAADYPLVAGRVARSDTPNRPVVVVLEEDDYESRFGEGRFLLVAGVYETPGQAARHRPGSGCTVHMKSARIGLRDDRLSVAHAPDPDCLRMTPEAVLRHYEAFLRQPPAPDPDVPAQ